VVLRNVDAGQTVVASPQAPMLFTIAQDLRDMQVEAPIAEADAARVHRGMPASFAVDAFPRRTFAGEIRQVRKSPPTAQNAPSHSVVISVANPDSALLPGMTANVRITVDNRPGALKVPNAALRFRPPGTGEALGPRAAAGQVWRVEGKQRRPVDVRLGISDGTSTEIVSGPLEEGDEVIIGIAGPRGAEKTRK
jgi:HlyD family secretion protein